MGYQPAQQRTVQAVLLNALVFSDNQVGGITLQALGQRAVPCMWQWSQWSNSTKERTQSLNTFFDWRHILLTRKSQTSSPMHDTEMMLKEQTHTADAWESRHGADTVQRADTVLGRADTVHGRAYLLFHARHRNDARTLSDYRDRSATP